MYSPFYDAKGNPLEISKVKYEHLGQLINCEEGHHLEFKLRLEDGGKDQIAKEITSFANCEGGWLVVGVEDKTKEIVPIEQFDYSQKVGKIASKISPKPEFETRFVKMPDDEGKGVLLIYVYEGRNAPYVCNGTVYIRCGSNKEPIRAAERGNIEYLVNRTTAYEKEINDFFTRDYYFPYNDVTGRRVTYPIIDVYLKRQSSKKDNRLSIYANRNKLIDFVKKENPIFEYNQFTMDSIVFTHIKRYPGDMHVSMTIEIFYDWSCKIYLPLLCLNPEEENEIKAFYEELDIKNIENYILFDAGTICNALMSCLATFAKVADKYKLREEDYILCTEIENAQETIMPFIGEEYKNYVRMHGLPYASKEKNRSRKIHLRDCKNLSFKTLIGAIVNELIGPAYGYESDVIWGLLDDSNMKYDFKKTD